MSPDPWPGSLYLQLLFLAIVAWCQHAKAAVDAVVPEYTSSNDKRDNDEEENHQLNYIIAHSNRLISTLNICTAAALLIWGIVAGRGMTPYFNIIVEKIGVRFQSQTAIGLCWIVYTVLAAFVVLFVGITLPQKLAYRNAEKAAAKAVTILKMLSLILSPAVALSDLCTCGIMKLFGRNNQNNSEQVTEEEIRSMVDIGSEHGAIEETEKEMIENIFEFNNHTAEDVMTHRIAVDCIWVEDDRKTVLDTILETGRSRFPVYDQDMDDIVGILNTRDFLLEGHSANPRKMREILREAYFVPETVQADVLFRDMQKKKVQMAIVADEYGGMAGIVTMEDLLEEIVGNIYDETDRQTTADIVKIGDNLWRISGSAMLEDVSEELDVKLPLEEEYDTLSGLVFDQFTTIPDDGTQPEVITCGLKIKVEKIQEHHVESALVEKINDDAENTQQTDEEQSNSSE